MSYTLIILFFCIYIGLRSLKVFKGRAGKREREMAPNMSAETAIAALITLSLAALLFCNLIRLKRKQAGLLLPPGPCGLPIVGSLPFLKPDLHHYLAGLAQSYGPVLSIRLGSKLCTVVSSPSAARQTLKDQDAAFANRAVPAVTLFYLAGTKPNILWSPYDAHWRMLRKIAAQVLLCPASSEAVAPLRLREMRRTVAALSAQAQMKSAVDVREIAFVTMLNTMTSMLWGEPVAGDSERKEFRRVIEDTVDINIAPNVADFFPIVARLDPQSLGRRLKQNMSWLYKYVDAIVEDKRKKMACGERSNDVLEALLDIVAETGNPQVPFTSDDLYKLLLDFIMASTDTTSSIIEWSMAELLNDPTRMRVVKEELDAVVGKHRIVEESDIPQLPYLHAVVKESLRLHPPTPLLVPRSPSCDCVVNGFSIPAGTTVLINTWAIQRDPCLWGVDAEEFNPERFFKTDDEEKKSHFYVEGNDQFYYLPFGAGRRVCPGAAMGEKMIIYMMASLLHSYDWQLPEGAFLELREKFLSMLRKAEQLVAVPTIRLDNPEHYA